MADLRFLRMSHLDSHHGSYDARVVTILCKTGCPLPAEWSIVQVADEASPRGRAMLDQLWPSMVALGPGVDCRSVTFPDDDLDTWKDGDAAWARATRDR